MQAAEDRAGDDVACLAPSLRRRPARHRDALAAPLVRPGLVAVGEVLAERLPQMALTEEQQVVEALPPDTPEEALGDRVGPRRADRRAHHGDAARRGYLREARTILAVIVADRKSTRLNSSHANISYAVFCLKKKKRHTRHR